VGDAEATRKNTAAVGLPRDFARPPPNTTSICSITVALLAVAVVVLAPLPVPEIPVPVAVAVATRKNTAAVGLPRAFARPPPNTTSICSIIVALLAVAVVVVAPIPVPEIPVAAAPPSAQTVVTRA
jgi:hypothetical protein